MNGRSGVRTFFLFALLGVLILMQWLSMMQVSRLENKVLGLEKTIQKRPAVAMVQNSSTAAATENEMLGDEGDWLVWRIGAEPRTLNPITAGDLSSRWVSANIVETLLETDPDTLENKPLLAESCTVSEDGLEIVFTLRDDIYFSDGVRVTADDVLFTFETIRNPKIDAAALATYMKDLESVEKVDDRQIRFMFKQVYFKSLDMVGGVPILAKHVYKYDDPQEFNEQTRVVFGSGPYVFDRWVTGQEIVVSRNENYWQSDKLPKLKKIVFKPIINDAAAVQSLRSGNVDYMSPLPEQFYELKKNKAFAENFKCLNFRTPGNGYFYIGWNQAAPFFQDRNVRLAMTYLVDRQAICEHLLRGLAVVPTGPFYIYSKQNDSSIEPWPYDPQAAIRLLDEAGWVDSDGDGIRDKMVDTDGDGVADKRIPFKFRYMIVSGAALHEQIVKLVKDSMAQAGIVIEPDPYEWSVFTERLRERDFDAVNLAWGGSSESDPYQIWHSSQIKNRGSNYIGFNMPEADALIEKARQTLDETERNKMYHQFHRLLHEQQPYTFVYSRPSMRFLDKRFHNVIIHKLGLDHHEWHVPLEMQKYQ